MALYNYKFFFWDTVVRKQKIGQEIVNKKKKKEEMKCREENYDQHSVCVL